MTKDRLEAKLRRKVVDYGVPGGRCINVVIFVPCSTFFFSGILLRVFMLTRTNTGLKIGATKSSFDISTT